MPRVIITMSTDTTHLVRLMAWLSPAFPTGAFAYSHGLESAIGDGLIVSNDDLIDWLDALLTTGSLWNDGVLGAAAWRSCTDPEQLVVLRDLAIALAGSAERQLETTAQGNAFATAATAWSGAIEEMPAGDLPLPVAFGAVAGRLVVPLDQALTAFMHASISNLVQAAMRLGLFGQQTGVEVIAELENTVLSAASEAADSDLNDLGSATIISEICAMRHETVQPRIFRS